MVVSPRSSHPFGITVVWYDAVVVGDQFMAEGEFPALFHNLRVKQFPHLCRRPEFSVSPRVMWIFNALDTQPYRSTWLLVCLATAAENRSMDRTVLIATESHGLLPCASTSSSLVDREFVGKGGQ
jgi:hypothetical protein